MRLPDWDNEDGQSRSKCSGSHSLRCRMGGSGPTLIRADRTSITVIHYCGWIRSTYTWHITRPRLCDTRDRDETWVCLGPVQLSRSPVLRARYMRWHCKYQWFVQQYTPLTGGPGDRCAHLMQLATTIISTSVLRKVDAELQAFSIQLRVTRLALLNFLLASGVGGGR